MTGGHLLDPSQRHDLCMKHASCRLQNQEGSHPQRDSLAACLGSNINSHFLTAIKQTPYETWMGFISRAHQPIQESLVPAVEECKVWLQQAWKLAVEAINHTQSLWKKTPRFQPYKKGERVWLEGAHLCTSHPMPKLRPKIFGPFEIL